MPAGDLRPCWQSQWIKPRPKASSRGRIDSTVGRPGQRMTDFDRIAPESHLVPARSIRHSYVMQNTLFLQVLSIGAITAALGGCVSAPNLNRTSAMTTQKSQVVRLLKAIES